MSKINHLLDGTTVINLPFFLTLFKRYGKSTMAIIFSIFLGCAALYYFQKDYFWSSVRFTDTGATVDSPVKALSLLLGDKKEGQRQVEIFSLHKSLEFTQRVADYLIDHPNFMLLRFDLDLFGDTNLKAQTISQNCEGNRGCIKIELMKLIPRFYSIKDVERNSIHYVLEVKALDYQTSDILLKALSTNIESNRVELLRENFIELEKLSHDLLLQKKAELTAEKYPEFLQESSRVEEALKDLDSKIEMQNKILVEQQTILSRMESKLNKTKNVLSKNIDQGEVALDKKRRDLREKIEKLTNDIHGLELYAVGFNKQDKEIVLMLKTELKHNLEELGKLGNSHGVSSYGAFFRATEQKAEINQFDYNVYREHFLNTQELYDRMQSEKKILIQEKMKLDERGEHLRPSVEFIKNLEIKVAQSSVLKETVGSDLKFDQLSVPEKAKKLGRLIVIAYSIVLSLFFGIFYLGTRFLWDDRIYDESDLERVGVGLSVIGITPRY